MFTADGPVRELRVYRRYWDWTLDGQDIEASPLLDGSEYSFSGNGEFIPNRTVIYNVVDLPTLHVNVSRPAGTGGGCVTTGPFANMQVPFGPFGEILNTSLVNNPANLDYRPHCLRRDLDTKITSKSFTTANVEHLLASPNISTFNNVFELGDNTSYQNLHAAGHFGELNCSLAPSTLSQTDLQRHRRRHERHLLQPGRSDFLPAPRSSRPAVDHVAERQPGGAAVRHQRHRNHVQLPVQPRVPTQRHHQPGDPVPRGTSAHSGIYEHLRWTILL